MSKAKKTIVIVAVLVMGLFALLLVKGQELVSKEGVLYGLVLVLLLATPFVLFIVLSGIWIERWIQKNPERKTKIKVPFKKLSSSLPQIVLALGGLLIALRLFFPPKYVTVQGMKFPYPQTQEVLKRLYPSSDFYTALLHALGIAVITGIILYFFKRGKAK